MDRLNELIEGCNKWTNSNITELSILLTELKQRRESDLRPADKYLTNTPYEQFDHLKSEMIEVWDEVKTYDDTLLLVDEKKLTEELIDLQMSAETMLAILGLNEQQRREARRKVIEKNEARGYYKDGVESED